MKQFLLSLIIIMACGLTLSAQSDWQKTTIKSSSDDIADCVYLDTDEKVCFLDLEKVPVNLKKAVLINSSGDEVLRKGLDNVPVNSIVELDYSKLPAGAYILELRSYRTTAHKTLQLK